MTALSLGCATSRMEFRHLPAPDALQSIQPGITTRSEVLRLLGPPEEMRRPANFDRARKTTPQSRRVLEEGNLFGRTAYTYAAGRRVTRDLGLIPGGPKVLSFAFTESAEERWRIEFDPNGVVSSVSHRDEIGAK